MAEHTPTPWQQGRLLSTTVTREWDDDYREQKEYEESALVCVNFHASDEGRSRRIIAVATHMDGNAGANAAFIVRAVNCHEELVAALEPFSRAWTAKRHVRVVVAFYDYDGKVLRVCDIEEADFRRASAALAKAKESRLQQQDLDEETL